MATLLIDKFYNYEYGVLEWRSVKFQNEVLNEENHQGVAVMNYTDIETPYTRIIEHKHFEKSESSKTIISKEYSNCTISFDKHTLYNKTYNGNKVKDEECLVLLIILGEGKGDNWWGSVYPKYLEVSGSDVVEYESLFITLFNKIKGDNDEN